MGVKLASFEGVLYAVSGRVSVPLRGNGCETRTNFMHNQRWWLLHVSVPLRGNGCDTGEIDVTVKAYKDMVSVPLRGNGCETPHIFEAYTERL